jgi:uncharacterized membrane protein
MNAAGTMAAMGCGVTETLCGTTVPKVWNPPAQRSRLGDVVLVLFLLAQCFDGVLTYVGVVTFGIEIEANPVVSGLMLRFGEGTALLGAKIVAAVLGIALHLRQVHGAVALLAAFYFGVAILPWTAILFM